MEVSVITNSTNPETQSVDTSIAKKQCSCVKQPALQLPNVTRTPDKIDKVVDMIYANTRSYIQHRTLDAKVIPATDSEPEKVVVSTEDGYRIQFEGKNQEWHIVSPGGQTTKIWGDPHVEESDGDKWDFVEQSSFLFGNNKVTVEVTPSPNKGATFSETVTVYNGDSRFTITGLSSDKPKVVSWDFKAESHDSSLDDGVVYKLEEGGSTELEWKKQ